LALLVRLFIAHGTEDWVVSIPIKTIGQVNRRSKLAKEVLVGRVWSGLVLKKKDIDFGCDGEVGKYYRRRFERPQFKQRNSQKGGAVSGRE